METNRFTTAWGGSRFKKKNLITHAVLVDVLYHSAGYFPMMVTNFLWIICKLIQDVPSSHFFIHLYNTIRVNTFYNKMFIINYHAIIFNRILSINNSRSIFALIIVLQTK